MSFVTENYSDDGGGGWGGVGDVDSEKYFLN